MPMAGASRPISVTARTGTGTRRVTPRAVIMLPNITAGSAITASENTTPDRRLPLELSAQLRPRLRASLGTIARSATDTGDPEVALIANTRSADHRRMIGVFVGCRLRQPLRHLLSFLLRKQISRPAKPLQQTSRYLCPKGAITGRPRASALRLRVVRSHLAKLFGAFEKPALPRLAILGRGAAVLDAVNLLRCHLLGFSGCFRTASSLGRGSKPNFNQATDSLRAG